MLISKCWDDTIGDVDWASAVFSSGLGVSYPAHDPLEASTVGTFVSNPRFSAARGRSNGFERLEWLSTRAAVEERPTLGRPECAVHEDLAGRTERATHVG